MFLPRDKIEKFVKKPHNKLCHPKPLRLIKSLAPYFFGKHFKKTVKKISQECKECQQNKRNYNWKKEIKGSISLGNVIKDIAIDIYGPINLNKVKEHSGKAYVLTIIDLGTRWTEFVYLKSIDSKNVIEVLKETWIKRHGPPKTILTDNGRQFISDSFEEFCNKNNIIHRKSLAYNPTSNEICE